MPELIDRQALIKDMCNNKAEAKCPCYPNCYPCDFSEARRIIDIQPTIEPEVRHGRWIDTPLPNSRVAQCSLCGFWQRTNGDDKTGKHLIHNAVYRYCAGCGAKMDGGADN